MWRVLCEVIHNLYQTVPRVIWWRHKLAKSKNLPNNYVKACVYRNGGRCCSKIKMLHQVRLQRRRLRRGSSWARKADISWIDEGYGDQECQRAGDEITAKRHAKWEDKRVQARTQAQAGSKSVECSYQSFVIVNVVVIWRFFCHGMVGFLCSWRRS